MHIPGQAPDKHRVVVGMEALGKAIFYIVMLGPAVVLPTAGCAIFLGGLIQFILERIGFYLWVDLGAGLYIGGCIGFLLGSALWFRISPFWEMCFPDERDKRDSHGSARFAGEDVLQVRGASEAGSEGALLIGCDVSSGAFLSYDGPAHLMTLAPTRSGKGVGTLIPNLLTVDRSVLVIDPKGENARITGDARSAFGALHVLDPFGISGHPSAAFNPLSDLDPNSLDLGEDAAALADALVFDPPDQVKDSHWNEEARALITGFILWCVCHEPPSKRTLGRLREVLTGSLEDRAALLVAMQDSALAGGLIARAANRHLAKPDREAGSVLSNAQRHTHFLDSPRMVKVTDSSSFRFAELAKRTVSVFVVLPPDRLDTYARWLRLIIGQALQDIVRDAQSVEMGDVSDNTIGMTSAGSCVARDVAGLGMVDVGEHQDDADVCETGDLAPIRVSDIPEPPNHVLTLISVSAEQIRAATTDDASRTSLPRSVKVMDSALDADDVNLVAPQRGGDLGDAGPIAGADPLGLPDEVESAATHVGDPREPLDEDRTLSPAPRAATSAKGALTASQAATDRLDATTSALSASEGLLSPKIASALAVRLQGPSEALEAGVGTREAATALETGPEPLERPQDGPEIVQVMPEAQAPAEAAPTPREHAPVHPDSVSQAQTGSRTTAGTPEAKRRLRPPTLFLMDEFASLGRLSAVERAMGLMAGYGVQLWPILQDLSQLKVLYGESANTFMANSGVIQTFGVNDYETAKWLSLNLGQETRYFQTTDHTADSDKNVHARDLLTPDEIMRLDPFLQILKVQNMRPIIARKIVYYSDHRFDPDWVDPETLVLKTQMHDPQKPRFTRQVRSQQRRR